MLKQPPQNPLFDPSPTSRNTTYKLDLSLAPKELLSTDMGNFSFTSVCASGQGRINHMAEAAYATGSALLAIFGGPAHSRKNKQTAKRQKRSLNNIFCDLESKTLGTTTPHTPTCRIPCNRMRPIYVAADII